MQSYSYFNNNNNVDSFGVLGYKCNELAGP